MIAVSLNVGGGVCLIKPAKLYTCKQKHYTHDEDGRTAPGVCGNGSIPLSHSGNVVTRIGIHTHTHSFKTRKDRKGVRWGYPSRYWLSPKSNIFPPHKHVQNKIIKKDINGQTKYLTGWLKKQFLFSVPSSVYLIYINFNRICVIPTFTSEIAAILVALLVD